VSGFQNLGDELDAWSACGLRATLWLRDDDACANSPALRKLLGIARDHRVPVGIAAIPAAADATLVDAIARCDEASVIQHGYAHRNHAAPGARAAELGAERVLAVRVEEIARGRTRLADLFGERFIPVLVPPWNRMAGDLVPHLVSAGFLGLSRFGPRGRATPAPGLREINTHVDVIAWRRERAFIGAHAAIERLVTHLRARRERRCDADEPTGLLTHHLVFDDAAWAFLDALFRLLREHDAVSWLDVTRAFEAPDIALTSARSA